MRLRNFMAGLCAVALIACGAPKEPAPADPAAEALAIEADGGAVAAEETAPPDAAAAAPIESLAESVDWPATNLRAKIITSKGDMLVELYPDAAPKTVANFVQYAKGGHYDRLIIHRVVPGFVIQGGGYNQYFNERPTRDPVPYEGENGLGNYRTTIAMARTTDPNSASAQWYVNLRDNNDKLDHFVNDLGPRHGYAVFGRVIEGIEVADAIGMLRTGAGGPFPAEVPTETVIISRVDIIDAGQ
jgi:peptidyl-prolyl cis-trans isomerase A (cyclophilin A)/peptidyl-prolyl cis-trans isomerase B (cyclophilin B)